LRHTRSSNFLFFFYIGLKQPVEELATLEEARLGHKKPPDTTFLSFVPDLPGFGPVYKHRETFNSERADFA
jgi:hypothetical protein